MKRNAQDMYFIRSNYENNILTIEAVYSNLEVDIVFHRHEFHYENENDANNELEAYKRLLSDDNTVYRLMVVGMADYFDIDYRNKSMSEVIEMCRVKRIELEKEMFVEFVGRQPTNYDEVKEWVYS